MRAPHNQIRPDVLREQRINPEDHGASVRIVSEMMRFPLLTSGSVVSPNPVRPWSVSYRNGPAPTTIIMLGDSVRVIARRLNATLSTLNMIGQPAYDFIIAWETDEGTATAHSDLECVDWATQSNNDLAAAYALPRAEV